MYKTMKRSQGRRGWWPVFRTGTGHDEKPVYDPSRKKLTARQKFEIAVGAVLTQNTAWTNVEKAMMELNRSGNISVERIRKLPHEKLAKLIRSSGYFNQKTKKLKEFVAFLDRFGRADDSMSPLRKFKSIQARKKLLEVKGIGPETADSILLYALDKPIFVVDAYTRRIFSRHGWIRGDEPYDEIRMWFERNLPRSAKLFNDYHAQIVEIGKNHCHRRRPECRECPLFGRGLFASEKGFSEAANDFKGVTS